MLRYRIREINDEDVVLILYRHKLQEDEKVLIEDVHFKGVPEALRFINENYSEATEDMDHLYTRN